MMGVINNNQTLTPIKKSSPVRYGTQTVKSVFVNSLVSSEEIYTERRVLVANEQEELSIFLRFRQDTKKYPTTTFRTERKVSKVEQTPGYYVIMGWTEFKKHDR